MRELVIAHSLADVGLDTPLDERVLSLTPHPENYTDFDKPIEEAFTNWGPVMMPYLKEGMFMVEFKSETNESAHPIQIATADSLASAAAKTTDGYHTYYPGPRDVHTRRSRSFCIWESPEAAAKSGIDPAHQLAMIWSVENDWYKLHQVPRYIVGEGGVLLSASARRRPPAFPLAS